MPEYERYISVKTKDKELDIGIKGDWTIVNARGLEQALESVCPSCDKIDKISFSCQDLQTMDTSGAWLLFKYYKMFERQGVEISFVNFRDRHFKFVQELLDVLKEDDTPPQKRLPGPVHFLEDTGRLFINGVLHTLDVFNFLGQLFLTFTGALVRPRRFRWKSIIRHIHEAGINAIPIILLMSFMIAIVTAYQGSIQLRKFGAEIYTVDLTAISVLREMGVLLTAILLAGRSGSAFTTEIGIMKINEEIDALKTLSLDPYEILVMPRVIALVLILPVIAFLADIAGLVGGGLATSYLVEIPLHQYWSHVQNVIQEKEFWIGMIKAPVFGFLIATTACFRGLQARHSAESVGKLTTVSVVQSIFLVVMADAIFAIVIGELGY
mgnify:CR=1 FL=1